MFLLYCTRFRSRIETTSAATNRCCNVYRDTLHADLKAMSQELSDEFIHELWLVREYPAVSRQDDVFSQQQRYFLARCRARAQPTP